MWVISLYSAIEGESDMSVINALIAKTENLNSRTLRGHTPLYAAMESFNTDAIKALVATNRCDLKTVNGEGNNVLQWAFKNTRLNLIEWLLDRTHDLDFDAKNNNGSIALHLAVSHSPEIVEKVICKTSDINVKNTWGDAPLHRAVFARNTETVRLLIEAGCDINSRTLKFEETALCFAIRNNATEIALLLLNSGIDVTIKNVNDENALHLAIMYSDHEMITALTKTACDMYCKTKREETAFMLALRKRPRDILTHARFIPPNFEVLVMQREYGYKLGCILEQNVRRDSHIQIARVFVEAGYPQVSLYYYGGENRFRLSRVERTGMHTLFKNNWSDNCMGS